MTTMSTKAGACTATCAQNSEGAIAGPHEYNSRVYQNNGTFNSQHDGRTKDENTHSFLGLLKLFENEVQLNGSMNMNDPASAAMSVPVSGGLQQLINRNMNAEVEHLWQVGEQHVEAPTHILELAVSKHVFLQCVILMCVCKPVALSLRFDLELD